MLRNASISKALETNFDIIIIGGGITGAGIFLKASQLGLKTLLLDKGDFASGTSSRSSKLIHGGLRYLQYLQIKMVYEGLSEREHLLKLYPHLVKPQPFFMPVYHSRVNRLKMSVGLTGYDYLQGKGSMPKHTSIPKEDISFKFPQIVNEDLKGGFIYYDARTNDARLTNEVVQQGVQAGGIAINYTEVRNFQNKASKVTSVECYDVLNQKELIFEGQNFVSATGVWTDEVLNRCKTQDKQFMKPSKGVHIVVSGDFFPKDTVLILPSVEGDGRFIWSVPWEDNLCVIGTTDTDYSESIDEIKTTKEEVHYLINAVNKYLIDAPLTEEHILSVYAGLRPLLNDFEEDKESTSRSRDYETWWVNDNFLCIAGGKLTSFLSMADHVITDFSKNIAVSNPVENQAKILKGLKSDLPTYPTYQILRSIYGDVNTKLIKNIVDEADNNALQLDIKYRYLVAEIIFFIRYQHAVTLDDIFTRRTLISYNMKDWDEKLINNVCNICVGELGWSEQEVKEHISLYRNNWELMHRWN